MFIKEVLRKKKESVQPHKKMCSRRFMFALLLFFFISHYYFTLFSFIVQIENLCNVFLCLHRNKLRLQLSHSELCLGGFQTDWPEVFTPEGSVSGQ